MFIHYLKLKISDSDLTFVYKSLKLKKLSPNMNTQKKTLNMGQNEIQGHVTFGEGCILNPTCSILVENKE